MQKLDVRFANASNDGFPNTSRGDLLVGLPYQSGLFIGAESNPTPFLELHNNVAKFDGVIHTSNLLIGGLPFNLVSAGSNVVTVVSPWYSNNSNVHITETKVTIGTSNIMNQNANLYVKGDVKLDGNVVLPSSLVFKGLELQSGTEQTVVDPWVLNGSNTYTYKNIGIGTSNPQYPLDVVGNINMTGNILKNGIPISSSTWKQNGSNLYTTGSNVGIGKSNPQYPLDVQGTVNLSGNILKNGSPLSTSQWSTSGSNVYILNSNVGIGTSNPTSPLDITGTVQIAGDIIPSGDRIQSIGTSNKRVQDIWVETIYLGSNTLYIGDTPIIGTEQNTVLISTDPGQNIAIATTGTGNTTISSIAGVNISTTGSNAQIQIRSTGDAGRVVLGATSEVNMSSSKFIIAGNINTSGTTTITGNTTIGGNLTVTGSNFIASTQTLEIKDNIVFINKGQTGSSISAGRGGISIDRGDASHYELVFDETAQAFKVGPVGATETVASTTWIASQGLASASSNLSDLTNISTARNNLGFATSCNVSFSTLNATSYLENTSNINIRYAPITTSNIAFSASNIAYMVSDTSNIGYAASNRAFVNLSTSGGTLTGTLTANIINATTLQQGSQSLDSLFAPISTSNITYITSNVAFTESNRVFSSTQTFLKSGSNVYLRSSSNLGLGGKSNPEYTLDVTGDINLTGLIIVNGTVKSGDPFKTYGSNVYLMSSNLGIGISNINGAALQVGGHVLPSSNLTFDLGTSNLRWRDIYLSGNTIHIGDTSLSKDDDDNIVVKERGSTSNLKRVVVSEIQLGAGNNSRAAVLKPDIDGNLQFYTRFNGQDTPSVINEDAGIEINSNVSPVLSRLSLANTSVPTITSEYVNQPANMSFGRVTLLGFSNLTMSNNTEVSLSITHNMGTSNYMIFETPDNVNLEVGFCNFTSSNFITTIRNSTGGPLFNPCFNYMIVRAPMATNTTILAQPPTVSIASSNMTIYSGATSTTRTLNIPGASDPQNYDLSFDVRSNVSGRFSVSSSNIVYNMAKATTTNSVVLAARNPYTISPSLITLNIFENFLNNIGLSNSYTISLSNFSAGTSRTYTLPGTDQGLPLTYIYSSNVGAFGGSTPSISGSNFNYFTLGNTTPYTFYLQARFDSNIMTQAGLSNRSFSISVTEASSGVALPNPILDLDATNASSYTSGSTWFDLSGNANNMTMTGTTFNSADKYFNFPGSSTGSFGRIPTLTGWNSTTYTLFYEFYHTGSTGWGFSMLNRSPSSGIQWTLNVAAANFSDYTTTTNSYGVNVNFQKPITVGWHKIVIVKNNNSVVVYLDGDVVASGTGTNISITGNDFIIGYDYRDRAANSYYEGYYRRIRVYNQALNISQVASLTGTPLSRSTYLTSGDVVEFKNVGTTSWTAPAGVVRADVLVVGGGGGGGGCSDRSAGGGGAGGVRYIQNMSITPGQTYTVIVGAGGNGGTASGGNVASTGTNGSPSQFGTYVAAGGGGGGAGTGASSRAGGSGGSGGGRTHNINGTIGNGTPGQGNPGGASGYDQGVSPGKFGASGGGGGGASGVSGSINGAGDGGAGFLCNITGVNTYYAGGGGGGAQASDGSTFPSGQGGLGGGGAGARDISQNTVNGVNGGNAIDNTGGGGGGAAGVLGTGGNGGSGIVIIRMYTTALSTPTVITSGLRLWLDANEPNTYIGSGTAINDISGFGNNYIMTGTSFSYDTLNRCITLSNNNGIQGVGLLSSTFGLNVDHTLEILCRPRCANNNAIIQAMNSNNFRTINVHLMNGDNGGTIYYDSHWTSTNTNNRLNYIASSSLNQIRHYVFRTQSASSSNSMDIFENNVKKVTRNSALSTSSTWGGSNNIFIGNWFGDFYMMRLYNRALTDTEVERNYANTFKYTSLPTSITGLGLWLDASDVSSITRSFDNKVSQWNDKSGNGRHFIQPDATKQPIFEVDGMNGLPSINIASEKALYRLASQMGTLASGTALSCFFVAEANTNNWSHVVSNWFNKDGADIGVSFNRFHHALKNNSTYQQSIYLNGGATVTNAGTTVSGGRYVGSFVYGGPNATSYYSLNGAASNFTSTINIPNTSGSSTSAFLIGKPDSQNYAATRVSEIIMFPRALSIDERQMIEGYLVNKYSLTANFRSSSTLPATVVTPNPVYPNNMNSVASWIWNVANAATTSAPDGTVVFEKNVFVSQPTTCAIQFQCDNYIDLVKVNGVTVNDTSIGHWNYVSNIPLQLPAGSNLISMRAGNVGAGAAGLIYRIVRNSDSALLGVSDSNTRVYVPPLVQGEYTLTKSAIVQSAPIGGWPTTLNSVASWIWNSTNATSSAPAGNVTFERQITVTEATACTLTFTCDDYIDIIMVNGNVINTTAIGAWNQTTTFAFSIPTGTNVLSMRGYNGGGQAGFIYRVTRDSDNATLAVSDANTRTS